MKKLFIINETGDTNDFAWRNEEEGGFATLAEYIRIKIARLSERVAHRYDFARTESDDFSHPMNYGNCD